MTALLSHGNKVISEGFFRDDSLDFQTRGVLGRAVRGSSEVGEVLATVARVRGAADWAPQWEITARRVHDEAARARDRGHPVSARSGFLRAATYWACALDGLSAEPDSDELIRVFRAHRECWEEFVACSEGAYLRVPVAYESTQLPGFLLRPDASGTPRPTLVITNGSDGSISDLWTTAAAGALARDWNAFVYDGPGQQSMLFEHGTHFRHDWEAVLTPVVDTLVARPDVDAAQLTGYGVSQAGYWLPRALAFEHRLVAAVIDPGVVDVSTSWTRSLGKNMRAALEHGDRAGFNRNLNLAMHLPGLRRTLTFRARPYRHDDWFDLFTEVSRYRLDADTVEAITTPMLITDPDAEQFWPGQSSRLAELVRARGGRADLARFTAEEGASEHVQPMGRLLTENRMFDWLEELVRPQPARS
ncbi:hypothetical protein VSH64_35235 [Amycolatopsis rhabdoformis]|uniref:Dipeptidyl aminopeptidase n=1 Tax=Amycolatopsis rhabdoformis TaxID=1448059 RepID=A0ABZ1I107_9PSEU|nr:hypothetical protein [Amycolatopsis rhabdoformis]WSE28063.1 hypothetical protein VSH64_35235 [Amycolatopsis rhabdoformis]